MGGAGGIKYRTSSYSSDFEFIFFFFFWLQMYFSFIGKAQFRRATMFWDSSYYFSAVLIVGVYRCVVKSELKILKSG